MPELPYEIWNERLKNEIRILKDMNFINENSVKWKELSVEIILELNALGFIQKYNKEKLNVAPIFYHQIFLKINRSFPYPGGIDFSWNSNIYHPNIHPVDLNSPKFIGTGHICLNILKKWSKLSDLETTAKSLQILVENPNPEDPLQYDVCMDAAGFFKKNTMKKLRKIFNDELKSEQDEKKDYDVVFVKD
jgi:ubiquitin-protein ligase